MIKSSMIVAGVMSGTSADGINVALVRMTGGRETNSARFELLGHAEYSYPPKVRAAVLAAMNATRASVADLARLNFLLGELYADAVLATEHKVGTQAELIGCHGQTLYHQGEPTRFLGRKIAATWQTGEAAALAARLGAPVVSDFRPADMAAGGKGRRWFPSSIICCSAIRSSEGLRKTSVALRTLLQSPLAQLKAMLSRSIPDRVTW